MPKVFLKSCKAYILDLFFPNRCPFCDEIISWNDNVCDHCRKNLIDASEQICRKCGNCPCECDCVKAYDNSYAALFFDDENVSNAIYEFKRTGMSNLAEYAAEIVCKYIDNADLVTSVPMGKRKQRNRGHNQADVFARCIAEHLDTYLDKNILYKLDTKEEQHHLSEEERAERVKNLFFINDVALNGKTIVLCDDVMTTGSTVNRCAELLKEMGADKVIVCVCAVTRHKNHRKKGD